MASQPLAPLVSSLSQDLVAVIWHLPTGTCRVPSNSLHHSVAE